MDNIAAQQEAKRLMDTAPHHVELIGAVCDLIRPIVTQKKNYNLALFPENIPTFTLDRKDVMVMVVKMEPVFDYSQFTAVERKFSDRIEKEMSERMIYIDHLNAKNRYTVMFRRPLPHCKELFETTRDYTHGNEHSLFYASKAVFEFLMHGNIPM